MQADKTKDTETERSIDDTQRIFGDILSAELDPFFSGERFSEDGMETPYKQIRDAIYSNNTELLRTLIDGKNLDINAPDERGNYHLHIDEKNLDINLRDERGNCHLHIAAFKGHVECVKILLANRANVNARDAFRNTPLHLAAKYNHIETLEALSKAQGVDFDAINEKGGTALNIAAFEGHEELVRVLLKNGVKANIINQMEAPYKYQALHLAAKNGHLAIVKTLIRAGADLDAPDIYGNTPLQVAIINKKSEVAITLIKKGAKINEVNNQGNTALELANFHGLGKVFEVLSKRANQTVGFNPTGPSSYKEAYREKRGLRLKRKQAKSWLGDSQENPPKKNQRANEDFKLNNNTRSANNLKLFFIKGLNQFKWVCSYASL